MLPGWYGFGTAVEAFSAASGEAAWRCCGRCTRTGRSSARCCPTWTWCWPRATWASPRAMPNWCRTRHCASAIFARIQAEWQRTRRCAARDHGAEQLLEANPALARRLPQPFALYRSAQPPAGGTAATLARRRDRRARASAASCSRSTASPRGCATAVDQSPRPRRRQAVHGKALRFARFSRWLGRGPVGLEPMREAAGAPRSTDGVKASE